MKKSQINEHDMTKKMLDVLRKPLIKEDVASESMNLTGPELEEEKKRFMEAVSNGANFEVFKVYPDSQNAVFAGNIDNTIEWQFTLSENQGLYITMNNVKLDDTTFQTLQKLLGYYKVWDNEWKNKIRTEYNRKDTI